MTSEIELDELLGRMDEPGLVLLDVRSAEEFGGTAGYPCDPRQGHIAGARNLELGSLLACGSVGEVRALVGAPPGAEVVVYCHSGSRSATAAQVLRSAGYEARNYPGSWHEWSRVGPESAAERPG